MKCDNCGACCKGEIHIKKEDADRIADALKIGIEEFSEPIITPVRRMVKDFVRMKHADDYCYFAVKEGGKIYCKVEDVKPENCRRLEVGGVFCNKYRLRDAAVGTEFEVKL